MRMHDRPFIISGALFVAAFALNAFLAMYEVPISQAEMIDWISWILSVAAVILYFSALINHKHHK